MSKDKIPKGWKTVNMGEILGPVHGAKLVEIWNRLGGDFTAVQQELKTYLQPFRADFEAKGFNVDYLSYALPFHVAEMLKNSQAAQEVQAAKDALDVADAIMAAHKPPPSQWN